MRLPLTLFAILLVLGLFQNLAYVPMLPDPVAAHFDAAGRADGHQSRAAFQWMHLATLGISALVLGGTVLIVRAVPISMVNVPNRDYHLAPERREASLAYICRWLLWFADGTLAFLLFVFQLTFRANLGNGQLPAVPMWSGLAIYMLAVAIGTVAMFVRFRKPHAVTVTA